MEAGLRRRSRSPHLRAVRRHVGLEPLLPRSLSSGACNRRRNAGFSFPPLPSLPVLPSFLPSLCSCTAREGKTTTDERGDRRERMREWKGEQRLSRAAHARARPLVPLGPSDARARARPHNNTHQVTHPVNKSGMDGGRDQRPTNSGGNGSPHLGVCLSQRK